MKHWYHKFDFIYKNSTFIMTFGTWLISTKEERILQKKCRKQVKCLKRKIRKERHRKQVVDIPSDIAIVAIIKDEADYLNEWIEYHKIIGVSKFIIYDHDSSDSTLSILQPYITNGTVLYHKISTPGSRIHHPQIEAYTDAVYNYRNLFKWMAFIDVDEFIVLEKDEVISDAIKRITQNKYNIGGIGVNWIIYGSSNLMKKPKGMVIENYLFRSLDTYYANRTVKTIANPRVVVKGGIHRPVFSKGYCLINEKGKCIDLNECDNSHEIIRINHYSSKSQEEQLSRINKGFGGSRIKHNPHDKNDVKDTIMLKYVNDVKRKTRW